MSPTRAVRVRLLAIAATLVPALAAATVSMAPSPSYTGSYTVSWTDASGSPHSTPGIEQLDERTVGYDLLDRPVSVTVPGSVTEFAYAPSGGRYFQKLTGAPGAGFGPKTVYYVDKDYELTVGEAGSSASGSLMERAYVGDGTVIETVSSPAQAVTRTVRYTHVDRLGSIEAATNDDPAASEAMADRHGFDPWGKPRGGDCLPSGDRLNPSGEHRSSSFLAEEAIERGPGSAKPS